MNMKMIMDVLNLLQKLIRLQIEIHCQMFLW